MTPEKLKELQDIKIRLNSVSNSFCLAKWTTVTLHLQNGMSHSCHHPTPHKILDLEIKENPSVLHNTAYKIEQRKKMLKGERPTECQYCWNIEDLQSSEFSDRVIKSAEPYSKNAFEQILANPLSKIIAPTYLEVSFSNACQFKCSYCSANNSSSWDEELLKFGNYPTYSGMKTHDIIAEEENIYVKAFWQWWPELKKTLHTFRITGGEPLLSPSTFKVLESLLLEHQPKLNLVVNTNLGVPSVLIDKFINIANLLLEKKAVASLEIYTSCEAADNKAEYIRNGLNYEIFWQNIYKILAANENINIKIMSTFNALSVTSYIEFLKKIILVNREFQNNIRVLPLYVDISYLRYPQHQTVQILTPDFLEQMKNIVNFADENLWYKQSDKVGLHDLQLNSLKRIYDWMKLPVATAEKEKWQKDFYLFFSEHDKRRGTHFLNTFPEMNNFWQHCKAKNEI